MKDFRDFGEVVDIELHRVTPFSRPALEIEQMATYDARGHRQGEPACLYAAEGKSTARAEFLAVHQAFAGVDVRGTDLFGRLLVLDLLDPVIVAAVGISVEALTSDDVSPECQRIVRMAFDQGIQAVRLPSVRDSEGGTVVIVERAAALAELREGFVEFFRL